MDEINCIKKRPQKPAPHHFSLKISSVSSIIIMMYEYNQLDEQPSEDVYREACERVKLQEKVQPKTSTGVFAYNTFVAEMSALLPSYFERRSFIAKSSDTANDIKTAIYQRIYHITREDPVLKRIKSKTSREKILALKSNMEKDARDNPRILVTELKAMWKDRICYCFLDLMALCECIIRERSAEEDFLFQTSKSVMVDERFAMQIDQCSRDPTCLRPHPLGPVLDFPSGHKPCIPMSKKPEEDNSVSTSQTSSTASEEAQSYARYCEQSIVSARRAAEVRTKTSTSSSSKMKRVFHHWSPHMRQVQKQIDTCSKSPVTPFSSTSLPPVSHRKSPSPGRVEALRQIEREKIRRNREVIGSTNQERRENISSRPENRLSGTSSMEPSAYSTVMGFDCIYCVENFATEQQLEQHSRHCVGRRESGGDYYWDSGNEPEGPGEGVDAQAPDLEGADENQGDAHEESPTTQRASLGRRLSKVRVSKAGLVRARNMSKAAKAYLNRRRVVAAAATADVDSISVATASRRST